MILGRLLNRLLSHKVIVIFIIAAPILILILVGTLSDRSQESVTRSIGIVDNDISTLSKAVENEFSLWYNCEWINSNEINQKLIEGNISFVLEIPEGYEDDLKNGKTPDISGYSLQLSEVQVLATKQMENLTKALMILANGAADENIAERVTEFQNNTVISTHELTIPTNWDMMAYWLGFYSFFSILISTFIINSLMDDRVRGMPDRIGTLPITIKSYNLQSIIAVFILLSVSMLIILFGIQFITGYYIKHIIYLLITLVLMNLISISLIMAMHSLLKNRNRVLVASSFVVTIFCMVGGVFWPLEFAPDFMQKFAYFSPNYWFGKALTGCKSPDFDGYVLPIILMALFTVVFFLLGSWKRIERVTE